MAFLSYGPILVTEWPGRLRIVPNGVLDPTPVANAGGQLFRHRWPIAVGHAGRRLIQQRQHPIAKRTVIFDGCPVV
jgi:hypothetical protein